MPPRNPHKRAWQRDRHHSGHQPHENGSSSQAASTPPAAYVQAYEAQLVYGEDETAAEFGTRYDASTAGPSSSSSRGRLLRWAGEDGQEVWAERVHLEQMDGFGNRPQQRLQAYDIVHLLTSLPETTRGPPSPASQASSSWDDLPFDEEDRFLLSGSDEEEYAREKKRKWVEALRQERLKGLDAQTEQQTEQAASSSKTAVPSGYDAEEELMKHTAQSLAKSPNPRILESRILTNHVNDERFAFLRGRYPQAWANIKHELARGKAEVEAEKGKKAMSGLMGGYASSDEEDEENPQHDEVASPASPPPPPPAKDTPEPPLPLLNASGDPPESQQNELRRDTGDDEKKRQMRLRLEEWKTQRAKAGKP